MQKLHSSAKKFSFSLSSLWVRGSRLAAIFLLCIGLTGMLALHSAPSIAISVQDVPNPRQNNGTWVTDMVDMLSLEQERQLNQMISELEAENGSEIAVVTVPDTAPSETPKAFATELFNTWGIGKAESNNGVLFLVSKGDRRIEIEVGLGLESLLTTARTTELIETHITPQFKRGSFDEGILNGTEALIAVLSGEPLPARPISSLWLYGGLLVLVPIVFLICKSIVFSMFGIKKSRGSRYSRRRYASSRRHSNATHHHSHNHYGGGYSGGGSSGGGFGGGSSDGGGGGGSW